MEEAVEEHQCKTISFSMVEDNNPKRKVRNGRTTLAMETKFSMPSVTLSSRKARQVERKCCHWRCMFRIILLLLPFVYYKEIKKLVSYRPQSVTWISSVKHDYSSVRGINDLNSDIVRPKCFKHIVDCPCQDPLVPVKEEFSDWDITFQQNKAIANSERARNSRVVFFGDSITEGWRGTQFGKERQRAEGAADVFDTLFSTETGSTVDGVALGIAGDKANNLLWRIQNGELPPSLDPSVFWILIGTNDIGNTFCSPEMVVVGILRVVEEIKQRRPNSHVVVNGLLPRTFNQDGFVTKPGKFKPSLWNDIKAINDELKLYATYRDGVSYFEANNVFYTNPDTKNDNEIQIDKELMSDYLHPTTKGYQLWGNEVFDVLQRLVPDL